MTTDATNWWTQELTEEQRNYRINYLYQIEYSINDSKIKDVYEGKMEELRRDFQETLGNKEKSHKAQLGALGQTISDLEQRHKDTEYRYQKKIELKEDEIEFIKSRDTTHAVLVSKLEEVRINQIKQMGVNTAGAVGENWIEARLSNIPGCSYTVTSGEAGSGDFIVQFGHIRGLVESKNYSKAIPKAEVDKFKRDTRNMAPLGFAIFVAQKGVSIWTPDGNKKFYIERITENGSTIFCIYITNVYEHQYKFENAIDIGIELTRQNNQSEVHEGIISNMEKILEEHRTLDKQILVAYNSAKETVKNIEQMRGINGVLTEYFRILREGPKQQGVVGVEQKLLMATEELKAQGRKVNLTNLRKVAKGINDSQIKEYIESIKT